MYETRSWKVAKMNRRIIIVPAIGTSHSKLLREKGKKERWKEREKEREKKREKRKKEIEKRKTEIKEKGRENNINEIERVKGKSHVKVTSLVKKNRTVRGSMIHLFLQTLVEAE
jgi:hypothetical protein